MTNFEKAMKFVSLHEWADKPDGEYTNDPVDPGGETKFGISKLKHPTVDIKNLTLEQAMKIYLMEYWIQYRLDSVVFPFSVVLMDSYVQHSPKRVLEWWKLAGEDITKFLQVRRAYYLSLIAKKPALSRFKNGWMNRLNDLAKYVDILKQT